MVGKSLARFELTRRQFMAGTAAGAAVLATRPSIASAPFAGTYSKISQNRSPFFPIGIASGDLSMDSVLLWTRYTGSGPLRVTVCKHNDAQLVHSGDVIANEGGFVHHVVDNLNADTKYSYAFSSESGALSGSFTTLPDPNSEEDIVLGSCSCTSNEYPVPTLEHAALQQDMRAFILLGDTSYNDNAKDVDDFRRLWQQSLSRTGYMDMRSAMPLIATWDDHEVENDFSSDTVSASLMSLGRQAFSDHLPIPRDPGQRLWKKVGFGRAVDVFVLDCRGERKEHSRGTDDEQFISHAQMAWLKSELLASCAMFKLIASSLPITDLPIIFRGSQHDRWQGYRKQRSEILSHIEDAAICGVIWLSGDVHFGAVTTVSNDGPGKDATEIISGPGAQEGNVLSLALAPHPRFEFSTMRNNYTKLKFSPRDGTATVTFFGGAYSPKNGSLRQISTIYEQEFSLQSL